MKAGKLLLKLVGIAIFLLSTVSPLARTPKKGVTKGRVNTPQTKALNELAPQRGLFRDAVLRSNVPIINRGVREGESVEAGILTKFETMDTSNWSREAQDNYIEFTSIVEANPGLPPVIKINMALQKMGVKNLDRVKEDMSTCRL